MYFQLLHGIHTELGKKYQTVMGRNEQGERIYLEQPVVESKQDLVALFGSNKFRRLTDKEAESLLPKADTTLGQTALTGACPKESAVAEAVKQGAVDIINLPGKDVTLKFTRARALGLHILYKDHKYTITDKEGKVLTTNGPILRSQVNDFITERLE